jgi:hypothetical protein
MYNPITGANTTLVRPIPIADEDTTGLMPKESFAALENVIHTVSQFQGEMAYLPFIELPLAEWASNSIGNLKPEKQDEFDTMVGDWATRYSISPVPTSIQEVLNAWAIFNNLTQPFPGNMNITDIAYGGPFEWVYNTVTGQWGNIGTWGTALATNINPGLVMGSSSGAGTIFVEQNGRMSVNGWDALTARVTELEQTGGTPGESFYDIWLGQGNVGTEQDMINSMKGAKGDPGVVPKPIRVASASQGPSTATANPGVFVYYPLQ